MGNGEFPVDDEPEALASAGLAEGNRKSPVRDHEDLDVWRIGMDFAVQIYDATSTFPREERYGLTSQLRRAAVSISANIAEGYGRGTTGAYVQVLRIARGSVREAHSLIELSSRLEFVSQQTREPLASEAIRISKMLGSLIRSVERSARSP